MYLKSLLQDSIPSLIFLQEIWLPFHEDILLNRECSSYSFKISTPDMFVPNEDKLLRPGPVWHGVALGWHDDISSLVTPLESSCDRFCSIRLNTGNQSLLIISLYAPTHGKDEEFQECLDHLSEFLMLNISENDHIIIGADSNCSTKSSERRKQAWKIFCESYSLEIKSGTDPTFHHHNGLSNSLIDVFVVSKNLKLSLLNQLCTLENPENFSSHDALLFKTEISTKKMSSGLYKDTYSIFKRERIIWDVEKIPKYQALAGKALKDAEMYWSCPESIPLLCSLYSNLLVTSAKLAFNTQKTNVQLKANKNRKLLKAERNLGKYFKYWKRAGRPGVNDRLWLKYRQARANFQNIRRGLENMRNIKLNNTLMHCSSHDRNMVYSTLKKLRNGKLKPITKILETPVGTYFDDDVLEGFAADAENLGGKTSDNNNFDKDFYNLCKLDNLYIFSFKGPDPVMIPPMKMSELEAIVASLKLGKACDFYQMTAEHLKHCGSEALSYILKLINNLIEHIYFLTCPQVKIGLGSALHKGKKKPITLSKSYRRITVTPVIGSILDKYVDPKAESIFRPTQSPDQLGFTAKLNYLMAAVQRGECQRWAIDMKKTCFGISLDGEAAFPSVEREIQVRELYSAGERGNLLQYSRNTYVNTECHIKMDGKLSRKVSEYKGNRQGHARASGHYKVYINPCLLALNQSKLGFNIGPICVTAVSVADDTYLLTETPSSLQAALNLVNYFGKRYRIVFNADKTKLVVTGSKADMEYYRSVSPWTLNNERITVCENNDHLGLVVSGTREEQKNLEANIQECRKSLFSLLGPAYAYKCLLPPTVKIHLWRTYNLPILRSGLSSLPIRPSHISSISTFQNKILRGFLHLSQSSPIPALYFLLGEQPIEALLHMDVLSLFFNIWSHPDTTVFKIIQYILKMAGNKSNTWAVHVRLICLQYGLPDPLALLNQPVWPKALWSQYVKSKVLSYTETKLRKLSQRNSKMCYLNVELVGLSGAPHVALLNIKNTQDVRKLRYHLKFLTGDYLTEERLSLNQGTSPQCKLCHAPVESLDHVLTGCLGTAETRRRILPDLLNVVSQVQPMSSILSSQSNYLTQFILDCTSLNLPNSFRVPTHNPRVSEIFKVSRDWCYAVGRERQRLLKLI